ncbi:MEDS domain-containing protein [Ramlibacter sp.]|uniref:MEDS domain-containing protein n=1 Tax=Ramlibacter sp. TaxID=1917967 RepID=UPI003D09D084
MNAVSRLAEDGGQRTPELLHACAFFDDSQDQYRALVPFSRSCLHSGNRCLQFLDPLRKGQRARRLERAGMSVSLASGGIELRGWDETYLRGGRFVADDMLALMRELVTGSLRASVWANMDWAYRDPSTADALASYEQRLNPLLEKSGAVVVCVYAAGRHDAEHALAVLQAHPWIMVDGQLERNPAYLPDPAPAAQLRRD